MAENEIKYCNYNTYNYYLCKDAVVLYEKVGCRYFMESSSTNKKGECTFKPPKERK